MRFHGLMVIRDEDDILPQCLAHLLEWIDAVYILDLGSKDSTWQIVQDAAARNHRVVPWKSVPYRFDESLRGYVFNAFRSRIEDGDWVLRLDADEFYHITPREFVTSHLAPHETLVYLAWYYFRLTSHEVEDYESGKIIVPEDRKRPIAQRRRFYKIPQYAEPRMFRYRSTIKWPAPRPFPFHSGYVAQERIPIRHYPHRDPQQMQKRYRLRATMMELDAGAGPHWRLNDWCKDVLHINGSLAAATEQTRASEGLSAAEGHTAGHLHFWEPGTALPLIGNDIQHRSPWLRRAVQRAIHPHLVRGIDLFRKPWNGSEPSALPAEIQARL
jgi:hypothetical protein